MRILSALLPLVVTTLSVACVVRDDDPARAVTANATSAPVDEDFGGCAEGHCVQTCPGGKTCEGSCTGGSCSQTCAGGATCHFACPGGSCVQTCAAGTSCDLSCTGDRCDVVRY